MEVRRHWLYNSVNEAHGCSVNRLNQAMYYAEQLRKTVLNVSSKRVNSIEPCFHSLFLQPFHVKSDRYRFKTDDSSFAQAPHQVDREHLVFHAF
jgi:hypothetical protein